MRQPAVALLAAAYFAVAFPTYRVPIAMLSAALENDGCILPEDFAVHNFQIWSPAANNNRTATVDFAYSDDSTSMETNCHYNSTSVNVGPEGLTPRYACENDIVEFIWRNGTLTLVEKACPETTSRGFEAAGSVRPKLRCGATERNSTLGEGTGCFALEWSMATNFTSLSPRPR